MGCCSVYKLQRNLRRRLQPFRYNAFSASAKAETVTIATAGLRPTESLSSNQGQMHIEGENPNLF